MLEEAQRGGGRLRDEPGVRERPQFHGEDSVRVVPQHFHAHLESEPSFTAAPRPRKREKTAGGEKPLDFRDHALASNEARHRGGKVTEHD